jgi:basic membrane protein A and related proteins
MASRGLQRLAMGLAIVLIVATVAACAPATAPAPAPQAPQPAAAAATQPAAAGKDKPKVAILMAVSCDDQGFGTPACDALKKLKETQGITYSISERVPIPDAETAMRDYAERGYDLIIGHGFQYGDAASLVAKEYPKTMFAVYFGAVNGPNLISIDPKNHENAYLIGIIAGNMSKSKKIGGIGGMEIPGVVRILEAYCLGAKSVDPKIECMNAYVNSWDDIQKGKEAAKGMIDAGADFFYHDASLVGEGMIQAAGDSGKYAVGFGACQDKVAPKAVVTSALDGIEESITLIVKQYMDGTLKGGLVRPGMSDGVFTFCPYNPVVPKDVQDQVEKARQAIAKGQLEVPEIVKPSNK